MRDLLTGFLQHLFAHQLGGEKTFRLICHLIRGKIRRAFRQPRDYRPFEIIQTVAGESGYRNVFLELHRSFVLFDQAAATASLLRSILFSARNAGVRSYESWPGVRYLRL